MDSAAAVPDFFTSLDPEPVSEAPGSDQNDKLVDRHVAAEMSFALQGVSNSLRSGVSTFSFTLKSDFGPGISRNIHVYLVSCVLALQHVQQA